MQLRPTYPIATARLRLRPLTTDDLPDLLAYRGDAATCRYLPFEPMDEAVLRGRLSGDLGRREITGEGQSLTLGAELIDGGRLVGDVVLFLHSEQHRGGELGYVFHPDVAGAGYATEASTAMLELAFGILGLHRAVAQLDARNDASARLAERLGMRLEAHHRRDAWFKGEWSDRLIYAILADEWAAPRVRPER